MTVEPTHGTDVLAVGEVLAAFSASSPLRVNNSARFSFVGAESNVGIGLSRLGHSVAFAGAVGDDLLGAAILRGLSGEGVDCTGIQVDPTRPTGMVIFDTPLAGVRRVTYSRKGSAGSSLGHDVIPALHRHKPRIVHVSGVTLALGPTAVESVKTLVGEARRSGAQISFDINYRSALWSRSAAAPVLSSIARQADILFGSMDEMELVFDSERIAAADLRGVIDGRVVLKRGPEGASEFWNRSRTDSPTVASRILDPVGAGDAFAAGYLSALLDGNDVRERLGRGHEVAAFALGNEGDWEGLPRKAELALSHAHVDVVR